VFAEGLAELGDRGVELFEATRILDYDKKAVPEADPVDRVEGLFRSQRDEAQTFSHDLHLD